MIIKNIYAVYFSPTGGTQKIAESLSNDLSQLLHIPFQKIDFTILTNRQTRYDFDTKQVTTGFRKMFKWKWKNSNHSH